MATLPGVDGARARGWRRSTWALGLLATLLPTAAGCGGARPAGTASVAREGDAPASEASPAARCAPDQAEVEGGCFSAAGTVWWFATDLPVGGHREFEIELLPGGRARVGDPVDTTPNNDAWTQEGAELVITMNDRYVTYRATVTSTAQLRGRGLNVRGLKWDFVMRRTR